LPTKKNNQLRIGKESLKFYLPSLVIICLIFWVHYEIEINAKKANQLSNETVTVELTRQLIGNSLTAISADVKMLSFYISSIAKGPLQQFTPSIRRYFARLSQLRGNYAQIRFINTLGEEIVRTELINGQAQHVIATKLRNKSGRYYFKKSMAQQKGEVYISPLDLNIEDGKVVEPYQPTIRAGIKVFDNDNKLLGISLVNYQAKQLIDTLQTLAPSFNDHIILITPQGHSLIQPNNKESLTFEPKNNFSSQYPNLWKLTQQSAQGQLPFQGHYFTFANIEQPGSEQRWTVISYLDKSKLHQIRSTFTKDNLFFYGLLAFLLLIFSLIMAKNRLRQKDTEQQRNYEKNFRFILKNIQQVAITVKQSGEISFCNNTFVEMVQLPRNKIIGKDWVENFIPAELRNEVKKALTEKFKEGLNQEKSEGVVMTARGEARLVSWSSSFTNNPDEAMQAVTFVGEDITESSMEKDKLRQLSHAVEQSPNSVMITNLEGNIIYVNPIFSKQSGYSAAEVMGKKPNFLQSGEMKYQDYGLLWKAIKNGQQWQGEFHNKKKNGEYYWESARISPVKDVKGNNLYYVAVKQDISEHKDLEQQVALQIQENIKNEKLASVGRAANMIAHDLRNPLSSIKMSLQMAGRQNNPKFQELFQLSLQQVKYMEAILEDLMTYSRPDQLKLEWVEINKLLEVVLLSCHKQISDSTVTVESQLQLNLPTINGDKTKLQQAMQNLLINAIQAAEQDEHPNVIISSNLLMKENTNSISISIKNNGKSLDPCLKSRIFEPFFTTNAKGTGLGLAIVQRIIKQHDGSIELEAMLRGGTEAKVTIPTSTML
jgi:PAS domain S-box-containing protein